MEDKSREETGTWDRQGQWTGRSIRGEVDM
jgi:hypothetical protein